MILTKHFTVGQPLDIDEIAAQAREAGDVTVAYGKGDWSVWWCLKLRGTRSAVRLAVSRLEAAGVKFAKRAPRCPIALEDPPEP